jgi:histidinol-phosphatase (PHP family)
MVPERPDPALKLPPDNHAHTEWSWDADAGSMEASCARAVELGLPSIAFTDHVEFTRWVIAPAGEGLPYIDPGNVAADGQFDAPPLDVDGYLECLQRCRDRFPGLRILSGVEFGEPHWHARELEALLGIGAWQRVLGSLHSLEMADGPWLIDELYQEYAPGGLDADGIIRSYLAEALRMVESSEPFQVLAHVDYPVRGRPAGARPFEPADFEEEFRAVLRALARSGRVLEVNTVVPLRAEIVRWWHEAGGEAVSFGSDAHVPAAVAHDFAEAAAMVEAQGFVPGRDPHDFWCRRR